MLMFPLSPPSFVLLYENMSLNLLLETPDKNEVYNHNFYWKSLSPDGGGKPSGELYDAIISSYGTYDNFTDTFDTAASGHFGSGWAWLVKNDDGSVEVRARVILLRKLFWS